MNRFLAVLAVAFLFPLFCLAQDGFQDVIYLKKGGFVKGSIVEQIPHKSVKILLQDGMVASFKVEEVDKILKERYADQRIEHDTRPNYIGVTAGVSLPFGSFAKESDAGAKTGIHTNLFNSGYFFTPNWGLACAFFIAVNDYKTNSIPIYKNDFSVGYKWNVWAYKGGLLGFMYSNSIVKDLHFDIRLMGGYSQIGVKQLVKTDIIDWNRNQISYTLDENVNTACFEAGVILRYNFARRFSAMAIAEVFTCNPRFSFGINSYRQPINTLSIGLGLAYRLS